MAEMPAVPEVQVVKRSISVSGTFAEIAIHPPLFDETVLLLVFLFPLCCLVAEILRRVSPCYIMEKRKQASERASRASARTFGLDYNLEAGDVDASKLKYSDAQRNKDREEEMAIKKRAAQVAAGK